MLAAPGWQEVAPFCQWLTRMLRTSTWIRTLADAVHAREKKQHGLCTLGPHPGRLFCTVFLTHRVLTKHYSCA